MERFGKTFSIFYDQEQDCSASRMVKRLKDAESEGRGVQVTLMRQWIQAGFLLEEIGRGLDTALIDMDQDGVFHSMSKTQQAEILIKLIQQKMWQYELMESAKSSPLVTGVSKPVQAISKPNDPEIEDSIHQEIKPPKKKKRRRPAAIVV